jgi:hypothetical protein
MIVLAFLENIVGLFYGVRNEIPGYRLFIVKIVIVALANYGHLIANKLMNYWISKK